MYTPGSLHVINQKKNAIYKKLFSGWTHLKNIRQIGWFRQVEGKIKNIETTT